jgi:heptosyltransferase-2
VKVAIFLPNWVGDVVMATPALRALREHFVTGEFIGVLRPYVASVLDGSPWLDRHIYLDPKGPWSRRGAGVACELWREQIDLAVLFPNSFHTAVVAWLGGCRRRLGYARYGRTLLLTDAVAPVRDARGRLTPSPVLDAYNALVDVLGCPPASRRLQLYTTPRDEAVADAVWLETGLASNSEVVCLNPGAAFGAAKHWPADYFAALAQQLTDQRGCGVLVLCGPAERATAAEIQRLAGRPSVRSLAEFPLSLGLTKACVRRADVLVTTDSGPRHFAAAFNRPVLTLFGPTHIAWTETYHPWAVHLQKAVPCGPCQQRVCHLDHRCMRDLLPKDVLPVAINLLDRWKGACQTSGQGLHQLPSRSA